MLLYPDVLVSFKSPSILLCKHANAMLTFVSSLPQEQLASNRTKKSEGCILYRKWDNYSTPWGSGSQM